MKSVIAIASLSLTLIFGSNALFGDPTQKSGGGGGGDTQPPPASKTTLKVTQSTGDFTQWVNYITINQPQSVNFFLTTKEVGVKATKYEIATKPWPAPLSPVVQPVPVFTTQLAVTGGQFTIDFKKFVPATPPAKGINYYVRASCIGANGQRIGFASNNVRVTYMSGSSPTPTFEELIPSDILTPMPVEIKLDKITIVDADEDGAVGNGDEPYLFVVALFADGTTIIPPVFSNSSVRLMSPALTHNNLKLSGVDEGPQDHPIPASIGSFKTTIQPIGINVASGQNLLGLFPDGKRFETATSNAVMGIVVVALEEDGSTDATAEAGRKAFKTNLESGINAAIMAIDPSNPTLDTAALVATLRETVAAQVKAAMKEETLKDWLLPTKWFGIADPDDHVDTRSLLLSYKQIRAAGTAGIPFTLNFKNDDEEIHYRIVGRMRRTK